MKKGKKIRDKQIKIVIVGIFLIFLCSSSITSFFLVKDNNTITSITQEQGLPKLHDEDNLLHFYDFEDNIIGEDPFGTTLSIKEDPADGSVEVANRGDDQQNHVLIHKTSYGIDARRLWIRDNVSYYGETYQAGEIHFRIYRHDFAGFEISIATSNRERVIYMVWSGNAYKGTIWNRDFVENITNYSYNQWLDVVIYFNLRFSGWMFDLNGIRYGAGYTLEYDSTFTSYVSDITWSSFASGSLPGGGGRTRIDDIAFYYKERQEIPPIYIDDSDPNNDWVHALSQNWCTGSGTWNDPYIIENVIIDGLGSGSCINISNSNVFFIIRNCKFYNSGIGTVFPYNAGIKLDNTNNGILVNNNCSNNAGNGILLINCNNISILENYLDNNGPYGILLYDYCDNNTLSGNIINGGFIGIYLYYYCKTNTIFGNSVNSNTQGITLGNDCDDNIILGNIANYNTAYGIYLYNCDNNTISENIANNNSAFGVGLDSQSNSNSIMGNIANNNAEYGIWLRGSTNNLISGNTINDNDYSGIHLREDCDNNIISGNLIRNNQIYGIEVVNPVCQNNLIYQNSLIGNVGWHARDSGTNNHWNNMIIGNYWDNHTTPDSNNDGIVDTLYTWISGGAGSVDNFPLAKSPIHVGDKIHIDNHGISALNWSRTAELNLWCTGLGTDSDPYIIDGLEIDAGRIGNGILIGNSSVYFIIRNCKIYNSGDGQIYPDADAGIRLENTNNGTLINNTCSNNAGNGILLIDCDNVTISENIANSNYYAGIYLYNSSNNYIVGNTANRNSHRGINLYYSYNNYIMGNTANSDGRAGVYLYKCNNNYIVGNTANVTNRNQYYGIYLRDCDNNTIYANIANNNFYYGIILFDCVSNTVSGNTANYNQYDGISLSNSSNNTISGNIIYDNGYFGIHLYSECDNNIITRNNAFNNAKYGIFLYLDCDKNTISWNIVNTNGDDGICLYSDCDNNIISGNTADNNAKYGIFLYVDCDKNTISENIAFDNGNNGIYLNYDCDNNSISGNTADNNGNNGIFLEFYCNENTILENIAINNGNNGISLYYGCNKNSISENIAFDNGNNGIYLNYDCDNNSISGNIAALNGNNGIYLYKCNNTTILGNFADYNYNSGIFLYFYCDGNIISGNTIKNNNYGIYFNLTCDDNTILKNYIYFNSDRAISISSADCDNNRIERNVMVSSNERFTKDEGVNTVFASNYYLTEPPSFTIEIIDLFFSTTKFVISIIISSQCVGIEVSDLFIQMWWNGIAILSNNITELGNGLYKISITPILVSPGENPILLNMTISEAHHLDRYFEMYISVDPDAVFKENTPTGSDVEVIDEITGINVTFSEVTTGGMTTIEKSEEEPDPPSGFEVAGDYYEITTDALYSGLISLAVPYNETKVIGNEENLRILHWDSSKGWTDITTGIDTVNNIIYGKFSNLSIFVVMEEFEYIFQGYVALRIEGKWYKGESKLYISDDLIKIEIGDQSVSWEITKHYEWRNYEYYYGKGLQGKIRIIIHKGDDLSKALAIGTGVLFYGASTVLPPIALNLNSLNLNVSGYVIYFISILMGLVGLIYRKKQVVHFKK